MQNGAKVRQVRVLEVIVDIHSLHKKASQLMVGVGIVSLGMVADGVVKKGTIDWEKINQISQILKVSARGAQGDSEENHHLNTVDRGRCQAPIRERARR